MRPLSPKPLVLSPSPELLLLRSRSSGLGACGRGGSFRTRGGSFATRGRGSTLGASGTLGSGSGTAGGGSSAFSTFFLRSLGKRLLAVADLRQAQHRLGRIPLFLLG